MKFTVSSSTLLKRLSSISGIISSNPIVPILDNFLFEVKEDEVMITASDLQTFISTLVKIESGSNTKIAIPSKILMETLKNLPEQPISFNINESTYSVEITSSSGRYRVACENAEDFPVAPDVLSAETTLEIDNFIIKKAFNKLLFATATNELKPAMGGVYVKIEGNILTFVATDGHKLSKFEFTDLDNEEEESHSFIIPKKPLSIITHLPLLDKDQKAKVSFTKSHICFNFGYTQIIARFINENFPEYNNVLPAESPYQATIEKEDFISSVKRVAIFANKTTKQVKLRFHNNEIQIFTEDLTFSNEASETLHCQYEGKELVIGFNSKFLIESLSKIDEDENEVLLYLGEPHRAVLIFPKQQKKNEESLLLVMPVVLNEEVDVNQNP